jgi:hypothetical protein
LATSVALMIGVLIVPDAARADTRRYRDQDEVPSCPGDSACSDDDFMDFRRVMHGHGNTHRRVRHGIRTVRPWDTGVLGGQRGVTIAIHFNLDRDPAWERQLRIRRVHGRLWAGLFKGYKDATRIPGKVRIWRPDQRSVRVAFHLDALKDGLTRYRWKATWWQRGPYCPESEGCYQDDAPDQGLFTRYWYVHRL